MASLRFLLATRCNHRMGATNVLSGRGPRCSTSSLRVWLTALLLVGLLCEAAPAQQPNNGGGGLLERTQELLDGIGRGMRKVGETAEGIFGPGMGLDEEAPAAHTEKRPVDKLLEVGPAPLVSISNDFGEIHVDAWEDRVVQVHAEVIVGAESASVAQEILRSIDVRTTGPDDEGLVQVEPLLPDRHVDMGAVSMQVNLFITVPTGADLAIDNFFGDTYVRNVGGRVALESQFGLVDLNGLGGPVTARVRGEYYSLRAQGLKQGGSFQLNGTQAEFRDIGGTLKVHSFRGAAQLASIQPEAEIDLTTSFSVIQLILPTGSNPDLTASVVGGSIESELPGTRSEQGRRILVRHGSPDARQRIDIGGAYSDIRIGYEGSTGGRTEAARNDDKLFNEPFTQRESVTPYTKLHVEGIRGDIQLVGTDEPGVHVYANKSVWVPSGSKAPAALDALPVRVQFEGDRLVVRSLLTGDMEALQCSDYRVPLKIEYPRNLTVTVLAEDGQTLVTGSAGTVTVEQTSGSINARDCAGPLTLTNKNGGIRVAGGTGSVTANARYGDTFFEGVQGTIEVSCIQGDTVVAQPGGAIRVNNNLGDVRILAPDSIGGEYGIFVEEGDLSMVLGDARFGRLALSVEKGSVESAIPLDGQILGRLRSEWQGTRGGQHSMKLEVRSGDIFLD